ncbi:hypothetical protein QY049_03295 [Bradyrhizobium sp. WYCCWR 13022]|uniref:hypothetical protein n=1 Tax=unclassified Bradyrhizobium TaxID=2631580 RepID=UPI00263B14F0|nr:hypothetical protein [Bradyrhizobium sp. WYCCWR 13022]MDN4982251.1 hypothetical protein [Bradyrhizobium sp. WYCCWR 13022]
MNFDWNDHYWSIGGDHAQVYSSKRAIYVAVDDAGFVAWSAVDGNSVSQLATQADLVEFLRGANVPPYHRIRKSTLISRLTDAQLTQAISMLTVRQQERWRAPDQPAVNADDPETLAVVQAVGADPAVVMAPE